LAIEGVGRVKHGRAASNLDAADPHGPALGVSSYNGDFGAAAGERLGHSATQNAGSANHDRSLPSEVEKLGFHLTIFITRDRNLETCGLKSTLRGARTLLQ